MSPIITLSPIMVWPGGDTSPEKYTELENYIVASYVWHVQSCKILFGHEKKLAASRLIHKWLLYAPEEN